MFIVIGARDFSPEITVHLIGTKVPCFDKVPPPQIPIYRALFSNDGKRVVGLKFRAAMICSHQPMRASRFTKKTAPITQRKAQR